MAKNSNEETTINKFTKQQIIESKKFKNRVDLLRVVLDENKEYSLEDVQKEIEKFMKGKVN